MFFTEAGLVYFACPGKKKFRLTSPQVWINSLFQQENTGRRIFLQ